MRRTGARYRRRIALIGAVRRARRENSAYARAAYTPDPGQTVFTLPIAGQGIAQQGQIVWNGNYATATNDSNLITIYYTQG